jgi:hypothetical protein
MNREPVWPPEPKSMRAVGGYTLRILNWFSTWRPAPGLTHAWRGQKFQLEADF